MLGLSTPGLRLTVARLPRGATAQIVCALTRPRCRKSTLSQKLIGDNVFFAQPLARAISLRLAEGNVMQRSRGALAAEFAGHLAGLGWIPAALAGAVFSVLLAFAPLVYAGDQREESFAVHHGMLLPVRTTVPIFR